MSALTLLMTSLFLRTNTLFVSFFLFRTITLLAADTQKKFRFWVSTLTHNLQLFLLSFCNDI